MKVLSPSKLRSLAIELGFNASLPCAVLDSEGHLIGANRRMLSLFKMPPKLPLSKNETEARFPFFDELRAGPALFRQICLEAPKGAVKIYNVEAELKTFKLKVACSGSLSVLTAELQRSGDLLSDIDSRQVLFRSLSHEIRTSLLTLNGYYQMLKEHKSSRDAVLKRMGPALKRLQKVVKRLDEFKVELQIERSSK